jgi:hypothetical protein
MEDDIMTKEINVNVTDFARQMSEIIGQTVDAEAIYPVSEGWYYYIQPPKSGSPMLLNSYKGGSMTIILLSKEDFKSLEDGTITPTEYINKANWLVGYFWGGGGMISGGYYQPMDIIGKNEDFRRYFKILHCRGFNRSCGYMPSKENCEKCQVENCPFCPFKELKSGDWKFELQEPDPRWDLFEALRKRFEATYPGFILRGFSCGARIPDNEIWLQANGRYTPDAPYSYRILASENVIRSLLMKEIQPEDWGQYASTFTFVIYSWKYVEDHLETKNWSVSEETLKKAYEEYDYVKKEQPVSKVDVGETPERRMSFLDKIARFFKLI